MPFAKLGLFKVLKAEMSIGVLLAILFEKIKVRFNREVFLKKFVQDSKDAFIFGLFLNICYWC